MKDKKLPKGVKDNSTNSETSGSFAMGEHVTRLNDDEAKASIAKMFKYNRGSFSGPLIPDAFEDEAEELLESEEKADNA